MSPRLVEPRTSPPFRGETERVNLTAKKRWRNSKFTFCLWFVSSSCFHANIQSYSILTKKLFIIARESNVGRGVGEKLLTILLTCVIQCREKGTRSEPRTVRDEWLAVSLRFLLILIFTNESQVYLHWNRPYDSIKCKTILTCGI